MSKQYPDQPQPDSPLPPEQPLWNQQPQGQNGQLQWSQKASPLYSRQPILNNSYPQQLSPQPPTKPAQKDGLNKAGCILASVIILACLLLANLIVNYAKGSNSNSLDNLQNTSTTQKPTIQPTELPTRAPTLTPAPGYGYHMTLGHSYSLYSNLYLIDNPTNHFTAASQFAFVVLMFEPFNVTHVKMLLVKLGHGGSETVVYTEDSPLADPNENTIWNSFPTSSLMGSNSYGNYRFEIEDDTSIRAYADFIYEQ